MRSSLDAVYSKTVLLFQACNTIDLYQLLKIDSLTGFCQTEPISKYEYDLTELDWFSIGSDSMGT